MRAHLRGFAAFAQPFLEYAGLALGLRLALAMRQAEYRAQPGTLIPLHLPGLSVPVYVRARTSDPVVIRQVMGMGYATMPLPRRPFILDAGANFGIMSLLLAARYPDARILAVEPEEANFRLLRQNVGSNMRITPVQAAVWSTDGKAFLEYGADRAAFSFRVTRSLSVQSSEVRTLTVDSLLEEFGWPRFDLVKMDIEGSEREVFAARTNRWISSVRMIQIELHDRFAPGCREALEAAVGWRAPHWSSEGEYTVLTFSC